MPQASSISLTALLNDGCVTKNCSAVRLKFSDCASAGKIRSWKRDSTLFVDVERAVLAYTDAMTRDIRVEPAAFAGIARHFPHRHVVGLTATIAAYNMVSRFLEALQVHSHDAR